MNPPPAASGDPRPAMRARLEAVDRFDLAIIGGGATGLGVAVDAAARGWTVALVERGDFAQGTSSRATKLLHGGVRYLAQGDIALVREALHERTTLLRNAPHLARPLPFLMPVFGRRGRWLDRGFYGAGLVLYDLMAGRAGLGRTAFLDRAETLAAMPGVRADRLSGAVRYWDGQFDDARLAIALARTAAEHGACLLNHCAAVGLLRREGHGEAHGGAGNPAGPVDGIVAEDAETGHRIEIRARCVVNATGVWVDGIRRMDRASATDIVAPSQGVHLVVDREFLPGDHALLVPKTEDGRVLFAVPWLGKVILGTTDTPRDDLAAEPRPFPEEVGFILREAGRYLARAPARADVRSVWVGLRPLVRPPEDDVGVTKSLSREHTVLGSASGLVTVTGGKWTTYRAMAEDVLERCMADGHLDRRPAGATTRLKLIGAPDADRHGEPGGHGGHGGHGGGTTLASPPGAHLYGTDAATLARLPGATRLLADGFSEAMVRFAVRLEFARSVFDVLARRSRLLFLDARLAADLADPVAAILADELGEHFDAAASAQAFRDIAAGYRLA